MRATRKYVYRFTFPDGMVYIGSTHDVDDRWQYHGTLYNNLKVGEAIRDAGWDNVKKEVIYFNPDDEAAVIAEEKRQIELHQDIAYNTRDNPTKSVVYEKKPTGRRSGYVHVWTIDGVTKPAIEWCKIYNRDTSNTLHKVLKIGLTPLEALTVPAVPREYLRNPVEFWNKAGFRIGQDKLSYVTPLEEWPDDLQVAYGLDDSLETDYGMTLGDAIKEMSKRKKITRREIAKRSNRNEGTMARAVAKNTANVDTLIAFANSAGYDVILVSRDDETEPPIKLVDPKT